MNDEFNQLTDEDGRPVTFHPTFKKAPPVEENGVDVPYEQVDPQTLVQMIKGFIEREGTDYGANEALLETKIEQIQKQLKRGDVKLVFDLTTETGSFVPNKR